MKRAYLSAALAGFLLLTGCSKTAEEDASGGESTATPVEVAVAKRQAIASVVAAEAVLYALRQATIVPKISAPIQRFLVQRGDHVRQGQLLAVLEVESSLKEESKSEIYAKCLGGTVYYRWNRR